MRLALVHAHAGHARPACTLLLALLLAAACTVLPSRAGALQGPRASGARADAAGGDSVRLVTDAGRCARCRVALHPVLVVGDSAGPGRLARSLLSVARDRDGRLFVAGVAGQPVRVFDARGRLAGAIGDSTAGDVMPPAIGLVHVGDGDTIRLLDEGNGRIRVHTPTLAFVRSDPLPPHTGVLALALPLADGRLVATGQVPTREAIGHPLHVVARDGRIERSFGDETFATSGSAPADFRKLARAGGGRLWAGEVARYRIERWTLDGARDLALARDVPWFGPYRSLRRAPAEPPHSMLMAMREDAAGRLWVLVRVADPRWREAPRHAVDSAMAARDPLATHDLADVYDTVLEVIDPACGRLLVSQRWPGLLAGFLDEQHLVEWRVRGAAPPRLGVLRAELHVPTDGRNTTCSTASSATRR